MMQGCSRRLSCAPAIALAVLPLLMGQGCPSMEIGPGQQVPDIVQEITPLDAQG